MEKKNLKQPAKEQTLDQFLDFEEQVRRGEIELSDSEHEEESRRNGFNGNDTTTAKRSTTGFFTATSQGDDDDSSSDSSDYNGKGNVRAMFRSLTINSLVQTPESSNSPVSGASASSRCRSTITSSEDSPERRTTAIRSKVDYSDRYYHKPTLLGLGRGRGRGILGGICSEISRSGTPSSEIIVDIASTVGKHASQFDSDDSDEEMDSLENEPRDETKDTFPRKPAFRPIKIIDKPEKIIKHKDSSPLDFPGLVLARGPLLMSPLGCINHFLYYRTLSKGIKDCGLTDFNSLQKSVTSHFLRGDDCFIAGGAGSGKSLSYLIPLVGKLLAESKDSYYSSPLLKQRQIDKEFIEKHHDHSPIAIIVCCDKRSAIKIEGHIFKLLAANNQRQLSYSLMCGGRDLKNAHKSTDIIITSVNFFSNVLTNSRMQLGFEQLRFIIFEDVDVLLRSFRTKFDHINDVLAVTHTHSSIQHVFCGKDWCPEVEDLYLNMWALVEQKKSSAPTVFINSPNQAIIYSQMKWVMHHCQETEKINLLIQLLSSVDLYKHKSIFVVCSTPEIAISVHAELNKNKIYSCLAETETMTQITFNQINSEWENFQSDRRIMVLNDGMLRGLHIYDATCLINFDMPTKIHTKSSTGANRFSCMWTNFRDIAKEKVNPESKFQRTELVAHFMLTGEESALYKLKNFVAKLCCDMPESLIAIAEKMEQEAINKLPICNGIKAFGRCVETIPSSCKARHVFLKSELEKEPVVPRSGEIEVQISECISPSVYYARVLRCYEFVNKKKKLRFSWIQNFRSISEDLKQYFEVSENRILPNSFEVGALCAVKTSDGIFRARILQILTRTASNYPKQLKVFCIDSGHFLQPIADNLLSLPERISVLPQLAVELILGNLQPENCETGYWSNVTDKAKELTLDKILNGKVVFSMGETVWVNPLVDLGRDAVDSSIITRYSIRLDLISKKCAEKNEDHLKNILDFCRKTDYKCLELDDVQTNILIDTPFMSKFHDLGDDYQWAFVSISSIENPEMIEIWASFTKDPYCIFGTNGKFENQLDILNKELNDHISEMISDRCAEYSTQFWSYYKAGMVVAVKDRLDETWHRGLIKEVRDIDGSLEYDVFLVDIGDVQKSSVDKELFPIIRTLVTKLPFQAIAFELAHIKPSNDTTIDWDNKVIDQLMNITMDEHRDGQMFDIVALQTSCRKFPPPCRCYRAFMLSRSGDDIGELLVQKAAEYVRFVTDDRELQLVKKNILSSLNSLYNQHHKELGYDNEPEDLPHEFEDSDSDNPLDVVGFDKTYTMDVLGIKPKLPLASSQPNKPAIELQTTSSLASLTEVVPDSIDETDVESRQKSQVEKSHLSAVTEFSGLKHPNVYWRQTTSEFILKIDHPDIRKHTIDVNKKNISFRTLDPPDYGFDIECYGTIEKTPVIFCTGQYLKITFRKRTQWPWPRPLLEQNKFRWLKEDMDDLDVSDEEDHCTNNHPIPPLPDADTTDSESDSDEDIETFMGD